MWFKSVVILIIWIVIVTSFYKIDKTKFNEKVEKNEEMVIWIYDEVFFSENE